MKTLQEKEIKQAQGGMFSFIALMTYNVTAGGYATYIGEACMAVEAFYYQHSN